MNDLILYTTEVGRSQIKLHAEKDCLADAVGDGGTL